MNIEKNVHEGDDIERKEMKREGAEAFAASEILSELFDNTKTEDSVEGCVESVSGADQTKDNTDESTEPCDSGEETIDIDASEGDTVLLGAVSDTAAPSHDTDTAPYTSSASISECDNNEECEQCKTFDAMPEDENTPVADDILKNAEKAVSDKETAESGEEDTQDNAQTLTAQDLSVSEDNETNRSDEQLQIPLGFENMAVVEHEDTTPCHENDTEQSKSKGSLEENENREEVLTREHFYHETQDPIHTENIVPTPTLELKESSSKNDDQNEQLSIFDIKAQTGEPAGKRFICAAFDFFELFAFTLAVVVILLSFVFRHSVVDGDSMLGTLKNGEHLIISDLFYSPERGDIIVFEDHATGFKKPLIKRIIAVGGDEIRISGKKVYLNGELLEEDYVYVDGYLNDASVVLVVPEGELFVMGDHRNESSDSRVFGTISEDSVIGRVILRFYPFDTFGRIGN